ncbi:alpha/beta fold hydrolase [Candidatus Gracilibacteria bacterium]|nr:alpha/beta fold hydrolase [Candidatus Gracilibacteria bacterium]
MKKALILHGWDGDSQNNWFPWLKEELKNRGYETIIPDLPSSSLPKLSEQLGAIEKYASELHEGDVIVGHSLGCQLATQFIEKHALKNLTVLLVAPTYSGLGEELGRETFGDAYETISQYYDTPNTFEDLQNTHVVFLSENDPYINLQNAEEYYCQFSDMEFVEFSNKGHFNSTAGVFELPELLEYV